MYALEDKMENCTEQMSKEITNINYDPPDNSQSSITAATNLSYSWYVSNGFGNSRKYIFMCSELQHLSEECPVVPKRVQCLL